MTTVLLICVEAALLALQHLYNRVKNKKNKELIRSLRETVDDKQYVINTLKEFYDV